MSCGHDVGVMGVATQLSIYEVDSVSESVDQVPGLIGQDELAVWHGKMDFTDKSVEVFGQKGDLIPAASGHPCLSLLVFPDDGSRVEPGAEGHVVCLTRETDDVVKRFIIVTRRDQERWKHVHRRVTYDRDTQELLADECVQNLKRSQLYRGLDKPRRLRVEFYLQGEHTAFVEGLQLADEFDEEESPWEYSGTEVTDAEELEGADPARRDEEVGGVLSGPVGRG